MTRFSPEYIAFILSDEASVLQKYHKWQVGTWYTYREAGAGIWIHHEFNPPLRANAVCLPGLSDLLDMIEEAGWRWRVEMLTPRPGVRTETCYVADAERGEPGEREYEEMTEEQRLLAAAKLAVRVLEEGKGG